VADFAWEALLLEALGIDDPDHADGPSDLLPLVRWAVEDARCLQAGLEQIQAVIEAVPAEAWEDGETAGDPLWEALDRIDALITGVSPEVRRAFRKRDRCRPDEGYHSFPHKGCTLR